MRIITPTNGGTSTITILEIGENLWGGASHGHNKSHCCDGARRGAIVFQLLDLARVRRRKMEVFLASSVRSRTVVRFFRPQLPPTSPLFGSLPLGIMPPASDQIHRPQLKAFLGNQSSEEEELQPERKRENKIRMEYLGAENEKWELTRAENHPSRARARWLPNP